MSTTGSSDTSARSTLAGQARVRVHHLSQAKARGEQIVMLTAYDAVTARILDSAGTDVLLVGDSMGNVMLDHGSTLPVTMEEMLVATRSVARATERALVLADLPFGSYESGPHEALANAVRLVKAGAHAVKLEGGSVRSESVRLISQAGIPVFGHIGFTPQSVNALGGYRVQGRGDDAAEGLVADALALAEAGAVAFIVEMVPEPVGARITRECPVPIIGIGAGARCDGQVLVWTDMAGMSEWSPRFAARFGQVGEALREAARSFGTAVRDGSFPAAEHWFSS
ncbi:3-methyl-2-oxobutanoate hydroxymethyltransferase [Actinomyces howellii]|uniref:3-methyl-2-oxobutanoate hydroxymethyltransferase n=1 Tax=Actinomyces howellii TaxID=52771 RepID=A0A3S4V345_9ACTO|nr:3-methyl-2-oxobutanoate hydroxymethyltransferase [Actinomyces howellii]VEG25815.1 3-methyl-2-oxobutanoate hydroxymethyltransferase [Actinomyces howellii]